jgi:hypothetical protein
MAKGTWIPFDSPEIDSMWAGADWKLLSLEESARLRTRLPKNLAGRSSDENKASPQPASAPLSEDQPPADEPDLRES